MKTSELKSTVAKPSSSQPELELRFTADLARTLSNNASCDPSSMSPFLLPSTITHAIKNPNKQMHFPASLMKLLCRGIYNNKKSSLKSKRLWEGMRVQVFSFTYRERRHYEISNLVKICYPIFLCVNKMFPKLHKIHLQNSLMNIYLKFYKTIKFSCYSEIHI